MKKAIAWIARLFVRILLRVWGRLGRMHDEIFERLSSWEAKLSLRLKLDSELTSETNSQRVGFSWQEMRERKWYYPRVIWNDLPEFLLAIVIGIFVIAGRIIFWVKEKIAKFRKEEPQ